LKKREQLWDLWNPDPYATSQNPWVSVFHSEKPKDLMILFFVAAKLFGLDPSFSPMAEEI